MLRRLREHRLLGILVGLTIAGLVAILSTLGGLPEPYPVVVALSVYVPIGAILGAGDRFDFEGYLALRGQRGIVLDATMTTVAALVGGTVATVAVAGDLEGVLQIVVIALGAFIAGQLVFYARSYPFHVQQTSRESDE